jgi:uncharacterized membrane protein YciS (DUF1049 family)
MASVKKLAIQKGWDYHKNYMYGKEGGYLITVRQIIDLYNSRNNCKLLYIPLPTLTAGDSEQLLAYLKENKKNLKVAVFEIVNSVVIIRLAEGLKGFSNQDLDHLLSDLTSYLKKNNISSTPTCVYCEKELVDTTTKIDKIAYNAHKECVNQAKSELEQAKNNFEYAEKNYGKGMLGAIIGGLIGAIPWMLLEMFWGFAAILSLLVGYAAFYGYQKLGGVVTKATKWLMIIPIVMAVFVSNIVSVTYAFIANDIEITVMNYLIIYTDKELGTLMLQNLGLGLFFGLLGYFSIYRKVKNSEFNRVIE